MLLQYLNIFCGGLLNILTDEQYTPLCIEGSLTEGMCLFIYFAALYSYHEQRSYLNKY